MRLIIGAQEVERYLEEVTGQRVKVVCEAESTVRVVAAVEKKALLMPIKVEAAVPVKVVDVVGDDLVLGHDGAMLTKVGVQAARLWLEHRLGKAELERMLSLDGNMVIIHLAGIPQAQKALQLLRLDWISFDPKTQNILIDASLRQLVANSDYECS